MDPNLHLFQAAHLGPLRPRHSAPAERRPGGAWRMSLGIALMVLGMMTPLIVNGLSYLSSAEPSIAVTAAALAVLVLTALGSAALLTGRGSTIRFRVRMSRTDAYIGGLVGVVCALASPLLASIAAQLFGESAVLQPSHRVSLFLTIAAVVIAAVAEELLFRAAPIELLRRRVPWVLTGTVPFIAFVCAHLGSWSLAHIVGVVMPLGVALTALYLWRRNLSVNVLAHLIIDAPLLVLAALSAV